MTHDELLAKIDSFTCCSGAHEVALRAVVELHKPVFTGGNLYGFHYCFNCRNMEEPDCLYPCPTIRAIEKELQ